MTGSCSPVYGNFLIVAIGMRVSDSRQVGGGNLVSGEFDSRYHKKGDVQYYRRYVTYTPSRVTDCL